MPDKKAIKKYRLLTYGCQMNVNDSEYLAGILEGLGYQETLDIDQADLILLNTCCVRQTTENRIFGKLGELKEVKKKKPDTIIAVCGCLSQQPQAAERILARAPHVDLIFGTYNQHRLPELLSRACAGETIWEIWNEPGEAVERLPFRRQPGVRAYVNIMSGCDNFCSYCIVPLVRGRERSRRPDEIIREVELLIEQGFKEVMLLGQNVNAYGKGLDTPTSFSDLLLKLDKLPGIERIRYMTSHPKDFSLEIIRAIASSQHVCEHFHLPVQAGSNPILKKMNRHYTREQYLSLIEQIRRYFPQASITTDIIVGFPGETESQFAETLELVEKVRFDAAYTFIYSPRSGTPAAELEDKVSREEKKRRLAKLMEVQNRISLELNQALLGKRVEVLVEGESRANPSKLTGRTRTNKIVIFEGRPELKGKLVNIDIKQARTWTLFGSYASS